MKSPVRETPTSDPAEGSSPLRPGSVAPDFVLPSIPAGDPISLKIALAEKKLGLVIFWSAVCSHCRRYDSLLTGLAKRYPKIGFVAVASRRSEKRQALARALEARRLRFRLAFDADLDVANAWQVQQTPTAFLLDAERTVLYRGAIDDFTHPEAPDHRPYLELAIADALAGRAVAIPESAAFGCPVDSIYYTRIGSPGAGSTSPARGGQK